MNGCGNRFVIFDAREAAFRPAAEDVRRIAKASNNADQVIAMEPSEAGDVFMRIWNADGSEVEACGNATRCVARLLFDEGATGDVTIATAAGLLEARPALGDEVTVDMGEPKLAWEDIPLAEKMDTRGVDVKIGPIDNPILSRPACVNMGNPHAVFFVEDIGAHDIPAVGPLVEGHMLFPEGVNVGFAQVLDRDRVRLRVWERGAGLTLACGTGACAALVAGVRLNRCDREARMALDGGELTIHWDDATGHVFMTGPVAFDGTGQL